MIEYRDVRLSYRIIICLLLLLVALYLAGEAYRSKDYRDRFLEMKGALIGAVDSLVEEGGDHDLFSLSLENDRGISVTGYLKVPSKGNGSFPALVVLGGLRTGRRTIEYLDNTRGMILLTLDYPYEGKRERLGTAEFISSIPRIRRAVIETVPAAMMAVEFLLDREDVDPGRVVAVGGSLGAFFIPALAASDERITAAAMLFGAGDIRLLLAANLDMPPPIALPVSWLGSVLVSPVEPLKYISRISPRPVFMLSGTLDPRVPERCSRSLHDAAEQPKTVKWIDAGHVAVNEKEFHRLVTKEFASWLVGMNLARPDNFSGIEIAVPPCMKKTAE
jgi:fermentation-respiration switch protein FrsA (DUF1100 family)